MKTYYADSFAATLALLDVTVPAWQQLCARRHLRHVRQYVRRVQRLHTGTGGVSHNGRYVRKGRATA